MGSLQDAMKKAGFKDKKEHNVRKDEYKKDKKKVNEKALKIKEGSMDLGLKNHKERKDKQYKTLAEEEITDTGFTKDLTELDQEEKKKR